MLKYNPNVHTQGLNYKEGKFYRACNSVSGIYSRAFKFNRAEDTKHMPLIYVMDG